MYDTLGRRGGEQRHGVYVAVSSETRNRRMRERSTASCVGSRRRSITIRPLSPYCSR